MSFSDWPNEILLQLLTDECLGRKDLCSLARVDRRFSEVVAPLLYRVVEFDINVDVEDRLYFLKRTIEDNPKRAALLRSLVVDWIYEQKTARRLENKLHFIVTTAPMLESLDLSVRHLQTEQFRGSGNKYD